MPNIRDYSPGDSPLQILIMAPYKTGKSFGAGTFPRPNFMDFDRHIQLFRSAEFVSQFGVRDIQYQQFDEKKKNKLGVVEAHNAFDDACRYFDTCMKTPDTFDTWVLDSGTTLSEYAANKAMVLLGTKQVGITSQTHQQALNTGLVVPKIQDYGAERSMLEQFIQMVLDSKKNVVLVCHTKEITNDVGIVTDVVPLLTGKSANNVPLKFDEVYFLRVKKDGPKTVRYLQTQPDSIRRCGTIIGIPDGTAWNYDAIQTEITKIKASQK